MKPLLILLTLAAPSLATDAVVVRWRDGDTVVVNVAEWPPLFGKAIAVRIKGIDCPEIHDKRQTVRAWAEKAKFRSEQLAPVGSTVTLSGERREKYFRIAADVWAHGNDVAATLKAERLAKPHDGRTKAVWKASECK